MGSCQIGGCKCSRGRKSQTHQAYLGQIEIRGGRQNRWF